MAFYVGQKVVCVDASLATFHHPPLVLNRVYTVAAFALHPRTIGPEVGLYEFQPVDNIYDPYGFGLWMWRAERFRPVQDIKTDISWARKLVADVKAGNRVLVEG